MVVATTAMAHWLSGANKGSSNNNNCPLSVFRRDKSCLPPPVPTLGILAFETAKTMSSLIALYDSVSDDEFCKLRNGLMKSQGVAFLISEDEGFLLSLACAEKLQELNRIASTVSRLSEKCSDNDQMNRFDAVDYANMRQHQLGSRNADKIVEKLEKYVTATSNLHSAMECLKEFEASERRLRQWERKMKPNTDYFEEKLAFQRKQVKHYKKTSLWSQTFDRTVGLLALIVCVIYARICALFGPYVLTLPRLTKNVRPHPIFKHKKQVRGQVHPETEFCLLEDKENYIKRRHCNSGPIPRSPPSKCNKIRFRSCGSVPEFLCLTSTIQAFDEIRKSKEELRLAPSSTVGAAGLMLRFASIITLAEKYLYEPSSVNDDARADLYEMLPQSLRASVRGKLWRHVDEHEDEFCGEGEREDPALAKGWRDAVEEMMTWLAPMAHDTMTWVAERNLERQRFDVKPTVMLLQTLYHADLEKTEAAIVEVLVGLSCILKYENHCQIGGDCR